MQHLELLAECLNAGRGLIGAFACRSVSPACFMSAWRAVRSRPRVASPASAAIAVPAMTRRSAGSSARISSATVSPSFNGTGEAGVSLPRYPDVSKPPPGPNHESTTAAICVPSVIPAAAVRSSAIIASGAASAGPVTAAPAKSVRPAAVMSSAAVTSRKLPCASAATAVSSAGRPPRAADNALSASGAAAARTRSRVDCIAAARAPASA